MRISDWSSDVCSSDLPAAREAEGMRAGQQRKAGRAAGKLLFPYRYLVRDHGAGERDDQRGRLVREFFRDRKRVVSGKRVSVRVDLGGRRIIKKKQIT